MAKSAKNTKTKQEAVAGIDKALLDLLVCPLTKKPLTYNEDTKELISESAKLAYPVRDGIPIMLADEARKLAE